MTLLGLVLSVLVLGGGALLLKMRLRATRAANAVLDRLATHGREITSGLDRPTVLATLRRQLAEPQPEVLHAQRMREANTAARQRWRVEATG